MARDRSIIQETSYLTAKGSMFTLRVYDRTDETYRAELIGSTRVLPDLVERGQSPAPMSPHPTKSYSGKTLDEVVTKSEKRIVELGGRILQKIPVKRGDYE